jgi:hypothetical protein
MDAEASNASHAGNEFPCRGDMKENEVAWEEMNVVVAYVS